MLPFTNIGRWHRQGDINPPKDGKGWSYAVWLQDAAAESFKERVAPTLSPKKLTE